MEKANLPFYVFNTHIEAEEAIKLLNKSGFDVHKLSLVGKGYHSEEHPTGFYTAGDRIKSWGGTGAFWGGVWGLLFGPAVFFLPGLGLVAMAGPFVAALVSAGCSFATTSTPVAVGRLDRISVPSPNAMRALDRASREVAA